MLFIIRMLKAEPIPGRAAKILTNLLSARFFIQHFEAGKINSVNSFWLNSPIFCCILHLLLSNYTILRKENCTFAGYAIVYTSEEM